MLTDIIYIGYWWPHLSTGQIFAARWELVGKHKSREHRRRDCVTRATVAEAIDVEYATGYPTEAAINGVNEAIDNMTKTAVIFSSQTGFLGRNGWRTVAH